MVYFVLILSICNLLLMLFISSQITQRFNLLNNRRQNDIADLSERIEILQVGSDRFRNWMLWNNGPRSIEDLQQILRNLDASVMEVKGKAMLESAISHLKAIEDHNQRRS